MRITRSAYYLLALFSLSWTGSLRAQDNGPFTCFNSQEIHFPIDRNDFSQSEVLFNDRMYNALYYLYQDKYSFWYKFIVHEELDINFSVSPSNTADRYRAVVFKYGEVDFCEKLVNENLPIYPTVTRAIFLDGGQVVYRNTIHAMPGDTFYISVLSLNRDDCGHFLHMESQQKQLSIHAIHKPCYNFTFLDLPDFSTVQLDAKDVNLELSFETNPVPPVLAATQDGFKSITSIEVESETAGVVSVGDKLILNQVFFYTNTYAFKPGSEEELDQLLNFLIDNPSIELEIQGHTANNSEEITPDPQFKGQGKAWNFKGSALELSEMRAVAVKDYLITKGISKKRIKATGFGDSQKRVANAQSFEDHERNMRVEALVTKQ